MKPHAYVNFTTVDAAIGFFQDKIPEGYEPVYQGGYVDQIISERNNSEMREYRLLGRIGELEKQLETQRRTT